MRRGFTLLEILVALGILAILMLAFARFFGSTLRASSHLQIQNELLNEAQVAHQLIASRVKEAWYVWPPGSVLRLAHTGWTTENTLAGSRDWAVGPFFLAMILPPRKDDVVCTTNPDGCFRFFAYYPMLRSHYVAHAAPVEALEPDPANDTRVWVLMEYRALYRRSGSADCPVTSSGEPDPSNQAYKGKRGRLLVDYVQPLSDPWSPAFDYPALFQYQTTGGSVTAVAVQLRLARSSRGQVYRVPARPGPLALTVEPNNLDVKARPGSDYCR